MRIKALFVEIVITFAITLVVAALVTYLWNLVLHGQCRVDWETSFRLAIILGIALPVMRILPGKEKKS